MSAFVPRLAMLAAAMTVLPACLIDREYGSGDAHVYLGNKDAGTSDSDAGEEDAGDAGDAGPLTNSISGSFGGTTLSIADSTVFDSSRIGSGTGGEGNLWVTLSDSENMCSDLTGGALVANSNILSFYLLKTDGFGTGYMESIPGVYVVSTVAPGANVQVALAKFTHHDNDCNATEETATDGLVTLNSVSFSSGGVTDGTFDFTFPNGHVTGSFSSAACSGAVLGSNFTCLR